VEIDGDEHYENGKLRDYDIYREAALKKKSEIKSIWRYKNADIPDHTAFRLFFWEYWDALFDSYFAQDRNEFLVQHIQELSKKMRENPNCIINNEIKINVRSNSSPA
jgi:hypothetical protein